ncbi:MAG TPA: DUF4157 domain-containing protein [Longimicrobium sp.]
MEAVKQKSAATVSRASATPLQVQRSAAAATARVQPPSVRITPRIQPSSLRVSSPGDAAEKEADRTAKTVVGMSIPDRAIAFVRTAAGGVFRQIKGKEKEKEKDELERLKRGPQKWQSPQVARFADTGLFRRPLTEDEERLKRGEVKPKAPQPPSIQRKAEGMPNVGANVAAEIQGARGAGNPLPLSVRRFMEPRFKADFGKVRVHTGDRAAKLNRQLNAKAFAVGGDVFFGKGQFRPETGEGKELIAHELTHTIQQGAAPQAAAVQRSEDATVTQQAPEQVQRLGLSDALDYFADKANLIPGFRMLTIILGVNPVNMSRVERSAANIMRAIVEFIPGGGLITRALDNYGVFDKVGKWVEQQIESLGMTGSLFKQAIDDFLDSLSWSDIFDLGGVWNRAKRIFTEPVDRLISFAKGLITGILGFIRDAILRPLAGLAQGTRGYDLVKALMGEDPITHDPYPRTPETVIGGFMKFIGQEDVWENIKKGNAVGKAWAWFQESLSGLMAQVRAAPGKFMDAVRSLTLEDIVLLPRAFGKVAGVFLDIIGGFFSWAAGQVMKLLVIVFEVVSPGAAGYIKKTGDALLSILKNPLPFVGNLGRAAKGGFMGFKDRFGTHLKKGLIDWLTGSLPGIYIPTAFSLPELVKFVFSALGLTWANVRAKLVRAVGETAVKAMETTFDIVATLVTQGPAAAWDKIKEALGSLQDMVIGGITDLVVDAVTKKAIPKLVAMFIPGAGFITAILSIYDMVMVFVNKISRIIQVVTSFVNSITAIAAGQVAAASKKVEDVLAGLLTLAINFLAGFAGLGRVSDKIMGVLAKVRAPIDKALDSLVTWIVTAARRLGKLVVSGVQGVAGRVAGWLGLRKGFTTVGGESHSMFFRQQGGRPALMIRSTEMSLETFLADLARKYAGNAARLARVGAAQQLVGEIRTMTSAPGAGGTSVPPAAAPPAIDAAVEGKITALGAILREIGDGVSTEGATAAYRGLHWWITPGQEPAAADREYQEKLNRQYVGARQLSDAVNAALAASLPPGATPTAAQIDAAVRTVQDKMASVRDATAYEAEGKTYYDRFHFLLGRYVTSLAAFQRRMAQAGELAELDRSLAAIRAEIAGLAPQTAAWFAAKHREKELVRERRGVASQVPGAYSDVRPEVRASPFIATSLDPMLTAHYALGQRFQPSGKAPREVGIVGRILVFVASVAQLVADGTYSIDELKRLSRIKMRASFSESELTFTGDVPGQYLRATLDVQAGQSPNAVAGNAMGRAAAEGQRFGGLK